MQGFIPYYNAEKGFGYVRIGEGESDLYFRGRDIIGEVKQGDQVSFWLDDSPKGRGLVAVEIKRISASD